MNSPSLPALVLAPLLLAASLTNAETGVPPAIAEAQETVELITWPIQKDPQLCFPQAYATVRFEEGRVRVSDVGLYQNRKPWMGDGLIEFRLGEKAGFIDEKGEIVIEAQFERVRPFSEGAAVVAVADKYGYIKKDGTWLRRPEFDWAFDFEDGYASASEGGRYGILNTKGEWHLPPQFTRLDPLAGGLYAVRPNGEEGFYDPKRLRFVVEGKLGASYQEPNEK